MRICREPDQNEKTMFQNVVDDHIKAASSLLTVSQDVEAASKRIIHCLKRNGKVLLMGNGGSAADAQHIAAELVVRYKKDRPALSAIALTTDSSVLTAIGNDIGFEQLFSRQVEALAKNQDILVGISTSGRSENVVCALRQAREQNMETIALTGIDGGVVAELADVAICVPSNVTARIQELHILIGHYWCAQVDKESW